MRKITVIYGALDHARGSRIYLWENGLKKALTDALSSYAVPGFLITAPPIGRGHYKKEDL